MSSTQRLAEIAAHFEIEGRLASAETWGSGHINDTLLACFESPDARRRYVFQRVNGSVFPDPEGLMRNVQRVTEHLCRRLEEAPGTARLRAVPLVPGRDGAPPFRRDAAGDCWRVYPYVEQSTSHDRTRDPRVAYEAARAFGEFLRLLEDLPPPRLQETLPGFHDTPRRVAALRAAADQDLHGRARETRPELDFAFERADTAGVLTGMLREGTLRERVIHGDTKLNNVLFDTRTGHAICVVDLDTVMPGLAAYDFGDLVRSATSSATEDERELDDVGVQMPVYEALARGYLESAGPSLDGAELEVLPLACRLMTFEVGIRFLTDHLLGDVYFRTRRPGQNLDRCRNQFALLRSMESLRDPMTRCIERP